VSRCYTANAWLDNCDLVTTVQRFAGLLHRRVHFLDSGRLQWPQCDDFVTSQRDISFNLEHLLGCGCVKAEDTGHLVLYGLSAPRLLQLEGIIDELLIAPLKGAIQASPPELASKSH